MTNIYHSRRDQAILKARSVFQEYPIFLDTETTGLETTYDEAIEIAVTDCQGQALLNTLVQHTPDCDTHPRALAVHHISDDMLKTAPTFPEIYPQLRDTVQDHHIVIYNSQFDIGILRNTARKNGIEEAVGFTSTCAMRLYSQFYGEWDSRRQSYRWQSLGAALAQCGIEIIGEAHRALFDAEACRQIMLYMAAQKIEGE